jgi:hypothetical protein
MRYEISGNKTILYIGVRGFIFFPASLNRACCPE